MQNTYESDLLKSSSKPFSKVAILECEKSKKLAFQTTCKHCLGVLYFLGLWLGRTAEKGMT